MLVCILRKPYQCEICLKSFTDKSNFNNHMREHTGEKPYQCEICLKEYSNRSVFNYHKQVHTGDKPYEICLQTFSNKSILGMHKKFILARKHINVKYTSSPFTKKGI